MRPGILNRAAILTALVGLACAASKDGAVTFHRDIEPILQKHCQECHRPGEIAPMSLMTYNDARPWAKAIRAVVAQKKMPPWLSDPRYGKFSNDRSLAEGEIRKLEAWAEGGAPEGDPREAPKPRTFTTGWAIGTPDLVLEIPKEFQVPATGNLPYQYIVFPTGLKEDKWVEKIEIRPGNRAVVHHAIAAVISPDSSYAKRVTLGEFLDPEKFSERILPVNGREPNQFSSASDSSEVLQIYLPGGDPVVMAPGQAKLIKAGALLKYQLHYTTTGKPESDRTRIGFVFAKQPPKERVSTVTVQNFYFSIPPMVDNHEIRAQAILKRDVKVISYTPHMHLRGKSYEYRAYYPNGESEVLLRVPRWDFNWQITYLLAEPKLLPKGTRLETIGYYDNSPNNPSNPNPKAEVLYGEQTTNEMMGGIMDFAIESTGSVSAIFDSVPKKSAGGSTAERSVSNSSASSRLSPR